MIDRILSAYNRNFPTEERGPIWQWCMDNNSVAMTKDSLDNMANSTLVFGFFGGTDVNINRGALTRLAKALGVRGIENPEGGANPIPLVNLSSDSDSSLLKKVESAIGFQICLPPFIGGRAELMTDYGILTERHCHYLWVLKRITELCPSRSSRILEIGAGIGLLGYFLDKAGYKDYTAIDLAQASACQSWFLHKNLPERNIILSGEPHKTDNGYHDSIKLFHANDFDDLGRFDIIVNIDGLTEMPGAHLALCATAGFMLSIGG
jgi:hypothetical protein